MLQFYLNNINAIHLTANLSTGIAADFLLRSVKNEIYADFYTCPNCGGTDVIDDHKYCPSCGIKLNWTSTTYDKYEHPSHNWVSTGFNKWERTTEENIKNNPTKYQLEKIYPEIYKHRPDLLDDVTYKKSNLARILWKLQQLNKDVEFGEPGHKDYVYLKPDGTLLTEKDRNGNRHNCGDIFTSWDEKLIMIDNYLYNEENNESKPNNE
jgi:hypothetical protein